MRRSSFNQCSVKKGAFHCSPTLWSYLKIHLQSQGVIFHNYVCRKRDGILKRGLLYQSICEANFWEHVRFETQEDFTVLQKVVGNEILYGIEKKRPSKRLNYQSVLHANKTCHVTTPILEPTRFTTRTPNNMGIDILFSSVEGMKIWVRFASVKASDHEEISTYFLERQNTESVVPPVGDFLEGVSIDNLQIVPGRKNFNHDHTMFRVMEVRVNALLAKVLQTRNTEKYHHGELIKFDDINNVKR